MYEVFDRIELKNLEEMNRLDIKRVFSTARSSTK